MTKIDWVAEAVPAEMAVRQVYCIMLDREGRVMLRVEKKPDRIKYSLAGGRPEVYDNGIEGTCRRELLEEVNTEIETPVYRLPAGERRKRHTRICPGQDGGIDPEDRQKAAGS